MRAQIIDEQLKAINFDEDVFCKDFYNLILDNKDNRPIIPDTINVMEAEASIEEIKEDKPKPTGPINSIEGLLG